MRRQTIPATLLVLLVLLAGCGRSNMEGDKTMIDPLTVERSGRPNDYLACPQEQCAAESDRLSPILATDLDSLRQRWIEAIEALPRSTIVFRDETLIIAEQRSALWGFVDDLAVRLLPMSNGTSFAVYSRSRTGYYDMGVNKSRVDGLIETITDGP